LRSNDSTFFNTDRTIFKSMLERAKTALGSDIFIVILTYHDNPGFEFHGDSQLDRIFQRNLHHELQTISPVSWDTVMANGSLQYYEKTTENVYAHRLLDVAEASNLLVAPFIMDDEGVGYGCWFWMAPRNFKDEDTMKGMLITDQISLAVKAYQSKKCARERGDKLAALLELSTAIYSSLNYTEVLQKAVKLAMEIMGADGGTIFILDKEQLVLKPLLTIDEKYKDQLNSIYLKLGEGITGKVAQSGAGIMSNHSEKDPRSIQVPGTPVEKESLISAPLTWSGEVIGAITLWSYSGRVFFKEDLEVLTIFARQTADAIENAKLFESLERAYEELSATQEQLIMAEKLKALGDMAGGVAHDFNNALGTILGRAQLLLKKITDVELRRELLIIEEVTLKGRRTVQRLQDFTHVSSRLEYDKVDLNQVVQEAIETIKPAWKDNAQRLGITIMLHSDLSPVGLINGGHDELKEAFCNVILNSVEALPNGGNIWIKTFMENDRAVLQIRDDGVGMDENTKNKLFFPFFTTKGKKSIGMGLAVVYGILFRHQVDISVDSKPGQGALFSFRFNTTQNSELKSEQPAIPEAPKVLSVLLVDDDINLLEVVGDMIDFMGHKFTKAEGGKEALAILKNERFDLVITDLGMPEVGGWDVARACRELYPGMPVILISGWGAQLDGKEALKKVDAVLPKPFQLDELKETIEQVVAESKSAQMSIAAH
jgi:signal transduction histidine kinase/CheY-like chemotaxis protein